MKKFHITLFVVLAVCASTAYAAEPRLLRPLEDARQVAVSGPEVLQSTPVTVDFQALSKALGSGETLIFDLAPDLEVRAVAEQVWTTGEESFAWRGRIAGSPWSSAVLAVRKGVLAGGLSIGPRRFQIQPGPGGTYRVDEIDLTQLPDGNDVVLPPEDDRPAASAGSLVGAKAKTNFDLIVFYTKKAKKRVGGKNAIEALIELGVAETNTALNDSKGKAKVRLRDVEEISYKEKKDMSTDLSRLHRTNDGKIDQVHGKRNANNADFVKLIVNRKDPNRCGIAFLSPKSSAPATFAFSVTRVDCISPNYTFGHELGHNWGLAHARSATGATPFLPFGWGFYEPGGLFRTIMAVFRFGVGPRVLHYSNPKVKERGERTGVSRKKPDGADAARAIRDARALLSSYR